MAIELPVRVRWGLSLNEGEILAAELEAWGEVERYRFRGYDQSLRGLVKVCADPWSWLEPLMMLPLGRMVATDMERSQRPTPA